jgi:predicted nucleic acid-binding protein
MTRIADSGLLIALLDRLDTFHRWAVRVIEKEEPPFLVCEAVCAEVAAVLGTPEPVLKMLGRGDLQLAFSLNDELASVEKLSARYRDRPMDLADACVVRMSELFPVCKVFTVDRADFSTYRRFDNKPVPCRFPDSSR